MKDRKKVMITVGVLILVILAIFVGLRLKDKDKKPKENDIVDPSDQPNKDNNGNPDEQGPAGTQTGNEVLSKPTITLNGSDLIYVEINTKYEEEGAKATDEKYGDLTTQINVTSDLDLSKNGTYTITYSVTNKDNQTASVTRTIVVRDTTAPVMMVDEQIDLDQPVKISANKKAEFTNHIVTAEDNSKEEVTFEYQYFYREHYDDEAMEVEKLDLSKLGYYSVYYTAVDSSMNKTEEMILVEYLVVDEEGPTIEISVNGNEYPEMNPTTTITAEDNYTDLKTLEYAWSTSKDVEPTVWTSVTSGTVVSPANGTHYLWIRATDQLNNESEPFVSEAFHKNDQLIQALDFAFHYDATYGGIKAKVKINELNDLSDIQSVVAKLYSEDTLLATNILKLEKLQELALTGQSIELETLFIIKEGSIQDEFFISIPNQAYELDKVPTKVVFEVTTANGVVSEIENEQLTENGIIWEKFFYDFDYAVGKNRGDFQSVQEAINRAIDEQTILVLPGEYDEQLVINKKIIILGLDKDTTIIKTTTAPTTRTFNGENTNPIIFVENGSLVLANVTITSEIATNDTPIDGIVVNNGELGVMNATITNIRANGSYTNAAYGNGVTAYGDSTVYLSNVHFNKFNQNGAYFVGTGVTAEMEDCVFIGAGATETNANIQNGVVYKDGASGSLDNNIFTNFMYHDSENGESTGILLDNNTAGDVIIADTNTFNNCDIEIAE